jgi:hypothetical protein
MLNTHNHIHTHTHTHTHTHDSRFSHSRQGSRPHNHPPQPKSHPTAAPPPMPTFTTIIDADHAAINSHAALLLSCLRAGPLPSSPPQQQQLHANHPILPAQYQHQQQRTHQLSLLRTITWRLIRHDLSEELIMRPAFIRHLGPVQGRAAADHDREDHERARVALLEIYEGFERCDVVGNGDEGRRRELVDRVAALMRELAEHMRRESGEELPDLERGLGREESEELGRRYEETLVVEPGLVVGGRRVWRDVGEYIGAGRERLLEVWGEVCREGESRRHGKL